jgi:hypothetical protein
MNKEVADFLDSTRDTFVRGEDYNKWAEEYGFHLFACLMKVKPDIAKALANTGIDPRTNRNTEIISMYLNEFWNHDFNQEGN